jgi:superfamily II DNA or RNA helicase
VKKYCETIDLPCEIDGIHNGWPEIMSTPPSLPGITFRSDQLDLINYATAALRGIIKAPTGTGKTILQMGLMSCYSNINTLLLAHTIAIVNQTAEELIEKGFNDVQVMGGGRERSHLYGKIVVSTMQTFKLLDPNEYSDYFGMVIIDEAHHVTNSEGIYGQILTNLLAPIRLGFTATLPTEEKAKFAMEGLLGPVIGEQTIQEASDLGILATPKIKLVKSRYNHRIHDLKRYQEVYEEGIVKNRSRNRQIVNLIEQYINEDKTILVVVTRIDHGNAIQNLAESHGLDVEFVQGNTESDTREKIKKLLIRKRIKCVITTAVWREGVNIPSLDVLINAAGGKSEIMTLQTLGRGLRKTEEKDEVIIVDFFDPSHHYLISHFGERVTLYMDNNWL